MKRCAAGLYDGQPPDKDGVAVTILSGFVFPGVDMVQPPYVSAAQADGEHSCFHHQAGNTSRVTCLGSPTLPQVTTSGGFPKCGIRDSNSVDVPGSWRAPDENAPGMFAMADQTCALDSTSKIRCWGINSNFELGKIAGGVPAEVFSRQWVAIAGGDDHTCGIAADDGKVYCWGENQYGQVGDGTSYEPSPVESGVP